MKEWTHDLATWLAIITAGMQAVSILIGRPGSEPLILIGILWALIAIATRPAP